MKLTDLLASYTDLLPGTGGALRGDCAAQCAGLPAQRPKALTCLWRWQIRRRRRSCSNSTPCAFSGRYDFEPAPSVWIGGEVRAPGKYRTSGQAHLRDAIFFWRGGVAPDASLDSAQLFRTQADGTMKFSA